MGQDFGSCNNINLKDWQQDPNRKSVYLNTKTGQ